jgi:hypothetical protein
MENVPRSDPIPSKSDREQPRSYDKTLYRRVHTVIVHTHLCTCDPHRFVHAWILLFVVVILPLDESGWNTEHKAD